MTENTAYRSQLAKAADMRRTPVEIDTEIAELMNEQAIVEAKLAAIRTRRAQLSETFRERGGWERAYLVNNVGGHVHRTTGCSTCYITTEFGWLTDESGKSEAEIVEAAGELACTVCYPTAPVEVLSRPGTIRRADQVERDARRAEKAVKDAEKAAAAVTDPTTGRVLYKTERAARNRVLAEASDALLYTMTHPSMGEWHAAATAAIEGLVAKGVVEREAFVAEVAEKAAKKRVKDLRDWESNWQVQQSKRLGIAVETPEYAGKTWQELAPLIVAWLS
ncbi:hypothetical protein SEA_LEMOND_42 [Mycobacterium phage LeMond]|uniref:Uncharacterized protein n=1 Tax=Mycobacterium phage KiSi TaxID=2507856 RepID=A0A410TBN1_9CAUD|nr:hypothetical protein I5G98_gp066 [Mycobacterium phage KiSi]AYR01107.1 hypothetical protein SEA_LEMOND_42 [Mycobacterium phage LeMond]QAU06460.1 hypothetical protein SEA_KISI_42 [Mycobacterium phage KiSi]